MRRAIFGLVACICAAAGTQPVSAADLPVKAAPPAVVVAAAWTGVYIGGHGGYGWADKDWTSLVDPPFIAGSHTATGGIAGGQIGANYQFGNWVIGVEGQYSWADLDGSHFSLLDPADRLGTNIHWLATATARFGYAFDRTLFYGKAGAAWTRDHHSKIDLGVLEGAGTVWRSGWIVGAGIEHAFWGPWSVKAEYNYMHFGTQGAVLIDPADGAPDFFNIRQRIQTVTVGVNYRFWSGGAVAMAR